MNDRNSQISRRDVLRMALGVGAGLALRPRDLWASHEAPCSERRAPNGRARRWLTITPGAHGRGTLS
jgi:hypothetical protein